jgi:hypothetical protein
MVPALTAALLAALCLAAAPAAAQVNLNDWLNEEPDPPPAALSETAPSARAPQAEAAPAPGGDTATRLQAAAREVEQGVGLVVLVLPTEAGGYEAIPFGTAWAFAPSRLGTNAHIAGPVAEMLEKGIEVHVLRNGSRGESYRVWQATSHPRYHEMRPNAFGRTPVGVPYDVGILDIEGTFPTTLRLADKPALLALGSGAPLALIGFPMERLAGDNVNLANPIATMQTGIVTSVSDFYLEDAGPEANFLIRHNLPSAGGASGSPLFTADGSVVGMHNGGNSTGLALPTETGTQTIRFPSAAQIKFAQRIDILADIIDR